MKKWGNIRFDASFISTHEALLLTPMASESAEERRRAFMESWRTLLEAAWLLIFSALSKPDSWTTIKLNEKVAIFKIFKLKIILSFHWSESARSKRSRNRGNKWPIYFRNLSGYRAYQVSFLLFLFTFKFLTNLDCMDCN